MRCCALLFHVLCATLMAQASLTDGYVVPVAEVRALDPRGFTVSIADAPGIELFAFHGHLNTPLQHLEAGTFSKDILRPVNGRWTYENDKVRVRDGDKLYYWTYVQFNTRGYRRDEQVWTFGANSTLEGSNTRPTAHSKPHQPHSSGAQTPHNSGAQNAHSSGAQAPHSSGAQAPLSSGAQTPHSCGTHLGSGCATKPTKNHQACAGGIRGQCNPTITTAGGNWAPNEICAGALIFEDNFDDFNMDKWEHEITMSGGGNWEFQVYSNNRSNSWTENGQLHIKPTLTIDQYGPDFLGVGNINLHGGAPADACTNPSFYGCERQGSGTNYLNPAKSARVRTVNSFHFKYGRVEVMARMPVGDWLWPAIWMMPRYNKYGTWPSSGEIDISEVRANRNLQLDGVNIGVEQTGSTMHYGPFWPLNGFDRAHWSVQFPAGLHTGFHRYGLEWTDTYMSYSFDGAEIGRVTPPGGGFWEHGGFAAQAPQADNPWRTGGHMAPFDQEYYIILNLAVGGTNSYFPDNAVNQGPPKPWSNQSPQAFLDFWNGRNDWYPTWNSDGSDQSELQIDYVRVWAL